jgi:orotate phosphoribosyltransferase
MNQDRMLEMLGDVGAVITDSHIVYTSGKHGTAYVNKDEIYPHSVLTADLCARIIMRFSMRGIGVDFDTVVGPEKGGIIVSQWAAYNAAHVTERGKEILAVYAEKEVVSIPDPEGTHRKCFAETGRFVFNRGYKKHVTGHRVLVVEDVLTTGGSVKRVIDAVRVAGGEVIGAGALCNRGNVKAEDVGAPRLEALLNVQLDTWDESDCPMCKAGVPINTDVGKGREFLALKRA